MQKHHAEAWCFRQNLHNLHRKKQFGNMELFQYSTTGAACQASSAQKKRPFRRMDALAVLGHRLRWAADAAATGFPQSSIAVAQIFVKHQFFSPRPAAATAAGFPLPLFPSGEKGTGGEKGRSCRQAAAEGDGRRNDYNPRPAAAEKGRGGAALKERLRERRAANNGGKAIDTASRAERHKRTQAFPPPAPERSAKKQRRGDPRTEPRQVDRLQLSKQRRSEPSKCAGRRLTGLASSADAGGAPPQRMPARACERGQPSEDGLSRTGTYCQRKTKEATAQAKPP